MKSSIKPLCKIKQFSLGTLVSSTNKTYCQDVNWNIVESGVKHHNPSPLRYDQILCRINNCLVLNTDTNITDYFPVLFFGFNDGNFLSALMFLLFWLNWLRFRFMVFNTIFNNILVISLTWLKNPNWYFFVN